MGSATAFMSEAAMVATVLDYTGFVAHIAPADPLGPSFTRRLMSAGCSCAVCTRWWRCDASRPSPCTTCSPASPPRALTGSCHSLRHPTPHPHPGPRLPPAPAAPRPPATLRHTPPASGVAVRSSPAPSRSTAASGPQAAAPLGGTAAPRPPCTDSGRPSWAPGCGGSSLSWCCCSSGRTSTSQRQSPTSTVSSTTGTHTAPLPQAVKATICTTGSIGTSQYARTPSVSTALAAVWQMYCQRSPARATAA